MAPFADSEGEGDFAEARADSDSAGQESAPMTEEEAPLEGLFHAGLFPLLTLFPPPLSTSSAGAELIKAESTGNGGEEGGAAAATI